MFQFSPLAPLRVIGHCAYGVAPFGYLRIKAWSAAPRSFSQLSHVLHRLLVPRHPPKALSSLTKKSFVGPLARPNPRPHTTKSTTPRDRSSDLELHVRGFRSRDPSHDWVLALSTTTDIQMSKATRVRQITCPAERERKVPEVVSVVNAFFR